MTAVPGPRYTSSMTIQEIIAGYRQRGAFFEEPTVSGGTLDEQESRLGLRFPASYREAITAGSYAKATFHFLEPYRDERDARRDAEAPHARLALEQDLHQEGRCDSEGR